MPLIHILAGHNFITAAWASLIAMILGFLLDLLIGDPRFIPHPVQLIGLLISSCERILRRIFPKSDPALLVAGGVLALVTTAVTTSISFALLWVAYQMWFWLGLALETIMCYQIFAVKSLKTESMKVYVKLKEHDLSGAREMVSMIVGRDTENLNEEQVTKAAVETIAESSSDGIIAPMLYMTIGGAVLGFAYKAVNTLDSMVGYRNDAYLYLGRISAILDDIVNLIPARLAGIFMAAAAPLCGYSGKNSWKIFCRDRRNHKSPNSAHTEAACAGALEIQLAGDAYYFGKLVEKPTIGDPIRPVNEEDIPRANHLMVVTAVVGILLFSAVKLLILAAML